MKAKTKAKAGLPAAVKIIVKGSTRNHVVSRRELGTVVRMIVREHGAAEDWQTTMTQVWNSLHGNHTVLEFTGLLTPLDPQRAVVLI
jgi:hypothetical protein